MPAPNFPEAPDIITRRTFISWLSVGWIGFGAAMGAGVTAIGRLFFPNVVFEPPQQFKAGFPDTYGVDKVDLRWKKKFGVWVVRNEKGIYALSTVCTHLGCTPNWLDAEQKFKCPCHGSGFYMSGVNFEGPAPRPLERYKIGLSADGQIFIDKTKRFQQELGQWKDESSFLEYS